MISYNTSRRGQLLASTLALLTACSSDPDLGPVESFGSPATSWDAGAAADTVFDAGRAPSVDDAAAPCSPAQATPQPMRVTTLGSSQTLLSASDLWAKEFQPNCGRCHVDGKGSNGGGLYLPGPVELAARLDDVLARITSEDVTMTMPPGSKPVSQRRAPDPILSLLGLLQAWKAAGAADAFPDPRGADAASSAPLASRPALGKSFTNLGSCVPAARIVGSETSEMDERDAKFSAMTRFEDLPKNLSETDLTSLDSDTLARRGVISYVPGYPLWADDAKKMRYVRVPRGKSIVFSPALQNFAIPDDTRFYKTFLKEVIDVGGNVGYKKLETRLIVVRHALEQQGQAPKVQALFGTYAWNEDETEAVLEQLPLRDATPFADDVTWYLTDEQKTKALLDDPGPDGLSAYVAVPDGATDAQKLTLGKSFLIGKKLARHYAIPGAERCLECHRGGPDAGFVLGFSPLQIRRRPMGEGGVIEPALADELNQLERFISYGMITGLSVDELDSKVLKLEKSQGARSPRSEAELIAQGYMLGNCAHCHNPRGYATLTAPVLADLLSFYPTADGGGIFQFPLERYSPRIQRKTGADKIVQLPYITSSIYENALVQQPYGFSDPLESKQAIAAPWRSLIYRNVETPFSYSADSAIYPHMPLNTPSYDPRAAHIMAEWMLSIPSLAKDVAASPAADPADQPMVEVVAGQDRYDYAVGLAKMRVDAYHAGDEYKWLPNTSDIIDPSVDPKSAYSLVPRSERLGLPAHTHWVPLDLTEDPPPWIPRRADWYAQLVQQQPSTNPDADKAADQARLVPMLGKVHADSALQDFARAPVPLALWKQKDGCDFSTQKKVAQLPSDPLSWWSDKDKAAPVYMPSRGEAVFGMICINCHGPNADSRGRQSDSLTLLSGGATRVANYRTGLFGPMDSPGSNMEAVFGKASGPSTTAKDWAMRYLAWMALGGTQKLIPASILEVVANGSVGGKSVYRGLSVDANMLAVARSVCSSLLPENVTFGEDFASRYFYGKFDPLNDHALQSATVISDNGDADLWRSLCSYENPAPVQGFGYNYDGQHEGLQLVRLYPRSAYPAASAVMDQQGLAQTSGLSDANLAPWCVLGTADIVDARGTPARMDAYYKKLGLARCPTTLTSAPALTDEEQRAWSLRGAINAGRVVFQYVDDLTRGVVQPQLDYTQCDKLGPARP
ncbi:MAG: hypothetical protein JWN04_2047 [Myxococcaceae bacterium]|nr:hypothetical protein [Myxococcaceae bacterium]